MPLLLARGVNGGHAKELSRDISGRVADAPTRLTAVAGKDVVQIDGVVGANSLSLTITNRASNRRIRGEVAERAVDLDSVRDDNRVIVTGAVENMEVMLEATSFNGGQTNIRGHVGTASVNLYSWKQLDGSFTEGYVGGRRVSVRDRDVEGKIAGLDPVEYLPALIAGATPE
ncbi:MAG: hypothetical protein FJX76_08535 [Armatimonadetes bacterium]|nr:hypothetical protein [Armatimonadota bacterium]